MCVPSVFRSLCSSSAEDGVSKDEDKVSKPISLDDLAAGWLADMEAWARREGASRDEARARVARQTGVSEGSLERVRRRRLKGIRGYVADRIRAAFVAALAAERARLDRELMVAERAGGVAADAAGEARAALDAAQRLIERGRAHS